VISGYGRHAHWLRNLRAGGAASVHFGRGPRLAAYRVLDLEEAEATNAAYERVATIGGWSAGPVQSSGPPAT
jgi:hypothetical protein